MATSGTELRCGYSAPLPSLGASAAEATGAGDDAEKKRQKRQAKIFHGYCGSPHKTQSVANAPRQGRHAVSRARRREKSGCRTHILRQPSARQDFFSHRAGLAAEPANDASWRCRRCQSLTIQGTYAPPLTPDDPYRRLARIMTAASIAGRRPARRDFAPRSYRACMP